MAILHIIANNLRPGELAKLVERSGSADAYMFMDDGVYVQLGDGLEVLATRNVFILGEHASERGLAPAPAGTVKVIDMSGLVALTASYASSMSW